MANQYDTNLKLQAIADAIGDSSSSGLIQALEDIADAVAGGGGGGSSTAGLVSDNFSETDTYDLGDYCIHNNTLYVCINAITTPGAWDLSDWQATNAGIQLSSLNSACANRVGYIDTTNAAITTITTYNADWTATDDVWCIGFCRKNSASSNNPQVFLDSITMANCSSIENTFFQFPVKKGQHIKTRNDSGGTYSITVYKML